MAVASRQRVFHGGPLAGATGSFVPRRARPTFSVPRRCDRRGPRRASPASELVLAAWSRCWPTPCQRHRPPTRGSGTEGVDVTFINTDGMSFIGPGSEWFWTALSGIVARRHVPRHLPATPPRPKRERLRADEQDLDQDWDSERLARHKLEVLLALKDGAMPDHLPDGAASVDPQLLGATSPRLSGQDTSIGSSSTSTLRAVLSSMVGDPRSVYPSSPGRERRHEAIGEHFEWLAGVMADMER